MFKGKILTDYTNIFHQITLKRVMIWFCLILKMNENNPIEAIDKSNLTEQTKFRLNEIIGIENYFYQEINQRKSYSKKLSKYITIFDYIDNILIISSATSDGVSIISLESIIGASAGIESASFTLIFSITTEIIKKSLSTIRIKRKIMIKCLC